MDRIIEPKDEEFNTQFAEVAGDQAKNFGNPKSIVCGHVLPPKEQTAYARDAKLSKMLKQRLALQKVAEQARLQRVGPNDENPQIDKVEEQELDHLNDQVDPPYKGHGQPQAWFVEAYDSLRKHHRPPKGQKNGSSPRNGSPPSKPRMREQLGLELRAHRNLCEQQ